MNGRAVDVHSAADALAAYARDVFWKDSPFSSSSRYAWLNAAAWLHEYAEGISEGEGAVHMFAPTEGDARLSLCGGDGATTVIEADVTCGLCRIGGAT